MSQKERRMAWDAEACGHCGRAPYVRRDGREYLYYYLNDAGERFHQEAACTPRCAEKIAIYERERDRSVGMIGHD